MAKGAPKGWRSITTRFFVDDVAGLVAFLRAAFDAKGELREGVPCELRIGDSMVMVSDTSVREAMPATLYLYVEDADATYKRAIKAGGVSLERPLDTPYGDRRAIVRDPGGNVWQIATRL